MSWKQKTSGLKVDRFVSLEVGHQVVGYKLGHLDISGKFGPSRVWMLRTDTGEVVGLNGRASLDNLMEDVADGVKVKVIRVKDRHSDRTGRTYQSFEVWTDDDDRIDPDSPSQTLDDDIPF